MNSLLTYRTEDEVINTAMHIMESIMSKAEYFRDAMSTQNYFRLRLGHHEREVFSVMFLNNQHQLIPSVIWTLNNVRRTYNF